MGEMDWLADWVKLEARAAMATAHVVAQEFFRKVRGLAANLYWTTRGYCHGSLPASQLHLPCLGVIVEV
jgi:hypothetical protein